MRLRILAALALSFAISTGCGNESGGSGSGSHDMPGLVSESYLNERALDYWTFATKDFSPGSALNLIAHMERERIDPGYRAPQTEIPLDVYDRNFEKMAALEDTRDFDALYLINLLLGYRDNPLLPAALTAKIEANLLTFKFWYTEPTPEGIVDNSYYWTENHQLIYHTLEYLMGQEYPDRPMGRDGALGSEHQARARHKIQRWFEHRARWGFFEWHSNVYYQKDLTPLLTLVEYADDPEIQTKAASILDILLFDIAMHTHRGAFGSTHGRSYKKDKMTSLHDDTWNGVKLLFDEATYDYQSTGAPDAVLLGRARRYRMPEAVLRVAKTKQPFVDRERMSLPVNELGPYEPNPEGPYGVSFTDPENIDIWWGMSGLTAWPVVPLTLQTFNQYNLWDSTNFTDFQALKPLTSDVPFAQSIAISTARMLSFALLKQVNTYTYRTPDYMLSTALDYRKGSFASQVHTWQATLDANALVFTTHPFRPPLQSTVWSDDSETGSYWTGEASMPRAAQHENVGIQIYAPQYPPANTFPSTFFRYERYTHAYFPQDHFDEVVQAPATGAGTWTFGRLGDGFVALYSWRPVEWISYDPAVYATNGMVKPFDLRADGGPNNVWIVECGRLEDWGSFDAFRNAVTAAAITVTPRGNIDRFNTAFDVTYDSPSRGLVSFGWDTPLTVAGAEIAQQDFRRYDNPFSQTEFDTEQTSIEAEGYGIELDVAEGTRIPFAP